jgi:hypothetical protein
MMYRSKLFRTSLKAGILFTALVFGLGQRALAVTPTTAVAPLILSGKQSDRPAGTYSAGIADILKMLDAKVDAQVIHAYIQNSAIPFNPDAAELIALKDHGAPTEMLTALLHRGDELRLRLSQAQSAINPLPVAPAYDYAPDAASPAYTSDYPDSSYAPYPAAGYSYSYGWPVGYWPSVYVGRYRPYWDAHIGSFPRNGYIHHPGEAARHDWASAAQLAAPTPRWVSAPRSGHASFVTTHSASGGGRGRGR